MRMQIRFAHSQNLSARNLFGFLWNDLNFFQHNFPLTKILHYDSSVKSSFVSSKVQALASATVSMLGGTRKTYLRLVLVSLTFKKWALFFSLTSSFKSTSNNSPSLVFSKETVPISFNAFSQPTNSNKTRLCS